MGESEIDGQDSFKSLRKEQCYLESVGIEPKLRERAGL